MSDNPQSDMTPAERRAYIRTQIPLKDWFNKTGAQLLRELEARGLGIPRSTFYSIRQQKLAPSDLEQALQQLGRNDTIPVAYAQPKPDWALSKKYLMQYKVVGRDPQTGEEKLSFFAVAFDEVPALGQATDSILGMLEGEEKHYEIIPEDATPYQFFSRVD